MPKEDLGAERTGVILEWVKTEFQSQQGLIGFAAQIQPDADDTAKGIICLNSFGDPTSSDRLVGCFGQGEWFKTYSQERNVSISTNCNAVMALLSDKEGVMSHSTVIANTVRQLCDQWLASATIKDKWVRHSR